MPTDTNVATLILNKLTKAQYDSATKSATELYLTPDTPASTTVLGPVKVNGTTIVAAADGTLSTGTTVVTSSDITNIVKCTQAEYDALVSGGTVSSTTFYIIVS